MDMTPTHIEIQYGVDRVRWVGNIEHRVTPCRSKEAAESLIRTSGGVLVSRTVIVTDWAAVETGEGEPW